MVGKEEEEQQQQQLLMQKIARIFDEAKASNATHIRKLKELSAVRSKSRSPLQFVSSFTKTLTPLFCSQLRNSSVDRVVRFISAFATATANSESKSNNNGSDCEAFLEEFLRFLLVAAKAANKTARLRACQMIYEIIMRLPDDAEVSDEVWDEVLECMKVRVGDRVPSIRIFAVRALSRFANDTENRDILDLLLQALSVEQNADVRRTIVLALPPSNATSQVIIDCTLDVSESVRKAAYCVLGSKFPLQSLSIKLRTVILQRGLADRSTSVSKECLKLLRDEWLSKCCNGNPVQLLKYLDAETYELVGESVMWALLKAGLVKLHDGQSIRRYISSSSGQNEGEPEDSATNIQLMEPEFALYWKTLCRHLQTEAHAKGTDAATTMGAESAVYAAEASDSNDLLERILPATVSDYVFLVRAHIEAGAHYRFAARQLLLLGAMLDYSDSTSRKVASAFVQDLLHKPLDYEVDDEGNEVVIGDGINLGGDKDWADAVSSLARKVHAATGEFEEVVLGVVEELARPCRDRTADLMQWMHSLTLTGLLLENAKSFHWLQGKAIEPVELLQSLLLPGVKHVHLDVQRVAIRCLGLFGLSERKPNDEILKQLRLSFVKGPSSISIMACKALFDLGMWHGLQEVDRILGQDHASQFQDDKMANNSGDFFEADENLNVTLLDVLYAGFDKNDLEKDVEIDEIETVQTVLGEGFAKILLLSENYPSIPTSSQPLLLAKLIGLYFSNETNDLQRLKQCLSVFFEHYPSLSANHKKYLSKAFIPVMRSMWPGLDGHPGGSTIMMSNMRKRAVQASKFMLQMMQAPLYDQTATENESGSTELPETVDGSLQPSVECAEEGLAIRIAVEVASFTTKKTPAEKSYISALCKTIVLLHFRASEQVAVKLMRRLLNRVAESVSAEKDLVKELKQMAERLRSVDQQPDEELQQDQVELILGRLELDFNFDVDSSTAIPQTPARPQSKTLRSRRGVRREDSSSEEISPTSVVQTMPETTRTRSQRASKTVALTKLTAGRGIRLDEFDEEEEEGSEITSEENSDDSDQFD